MLGSCTGVKAKPLPEQVPNAWFLRMTACHLNVQKKSQTFFQEFETSNSIVKSVYSKEAGKSMVLRSAKHARIPRLWHTQRRWNLKGQMDRRIKFAARGTNYTARGT